MIITSLFTCFAVENIDWEDLSNRTHLPVEVLKQSYDIMDYESFISSVEGIENSINSTPESDSDTVSPIMGAGDFADIRKKTRNGSVWITKDTGSSLYEHGHAAIVVDVDDSPTYPNIVTIEHRGYNYTYSARYGSTYDTYWSGRRTMRTYDVRSNTSSSSANTSAMSAAARYAENNLIGKKYNALALKSESGVNCATLVYKAYMSQGIALENPASNTVIPKDIVQDSNVILRGNYGWLGNGHIW